MLPPSFSYAPRRTWDGHPCTRPDLFWCYPLCGACVFSCCVCPFLLLHGALSIHLHVSPSISMSPSCCRHVCFLMPTGLSLMRAVSPFMPSVFFLLICPFLVFLFLCSTARVGRGEGHPFTRPDLFWCYPLCGAGFCLCCACPFLMLHGALSIHLHVSASISMSPILLSTFFSRTANLTFFYAAPVLLVLHGPRDGEGEGMGLIWARPCFMAFTRSRSFFYADSLLCILHLSASRPCCAMAPPAAPPAAPPTSSSTSQHQHQHQQHQHQHQHQHQQHQQQ